MFTSPFVSLVERMNLLELKHRHGIEDLKRAVGEIEEQIRDMDNRNERQFAKIEKRLDCMEIMINRQSEKIERSVFGYSC